MKKEVTLDLGRICQHEKLPVLDDEDVMSVHDKDGNKTLAINVCAKCMLLYAEVIAEDLLKEKKDEA